MLLMKLSLAVMLAATSCKPWAEVVWPTAVKCLSAPSGELVAQVRAIVEQDGIASVFSDASVDALEDLARVHGAATIACVLQELIDRYTAPTGMQAPPEQLARARRAQNFLNEREVEVRQP